MLGKDLEDLKTMKHIATLHTQDNKGTNMPLFVVFRKERLYNVVDGYEDGWQWKDAIEWTDATEEESKALDAISDPGKYASLGKTEFIGCPYIWVDKFVTAFFTMRGAQDFIEENRHNLQDPHVSVFSLYGNQEMIGIRDHLMALSYPEEERP